MRSAIRQSLAAGAIALASIASPAAPLDQLADGYLASVLDLFTAGDGVPMAYGFKTPSAVTIDPVTGEVWVADFGNRVLRFSSTAAYISGSAANVVLGQADPTASAPNRGGAAAANTLTTPGGLAVDQRGHLYVADTSNHRVLVFAPPFRTGMNAKYVIGQDSFTAVQPNRGTGGARNDSFNAPTGLHIDTRGNLYVADLNNHRVVRMDPPHIPFAVFTAVYGQPSFTSTTAPLDANGLALPIGVAVAPNDDLWVVDVGNRILRYDQGAAMPASSANKTADAVLCQTDFSSSGASSALNGCNFPSGIAIAADGSIFVTDYQNHRVLRFAPGAGTGAAAAEVYGQYGVENTCNRAQGGPSNDSFCQPRYPAISPQGDLWIADAGNHRVLRFDFVRPRPAPQVATLGPSTQFRGAGDFLLTVTGDGFDRASRVRWNGAERPTSFLSTRRLVAQIRASDVATVGSHSVTVESPAPGGGTSAAASFSVYLRAYGDKVADRVLFRPAFESEGAVPEQRIGQELHGMHNGATAAAPGRKFAAVDAASGRFFVMDEGNSRVLSWPSARAMTNGDGADVVFGQPDEWTTGCAPLHSASTLCFPSGLHVAPNGSLYVSDSGAMRILRYDPPFVTGMAAARVLGAGNFNSLGILATPSGLAVRGSSLFALSAGRVIRFDDPDNSSSFAVVTSGLPTYPRSMAFDVDSRMFVNEASSVRVYQPNGLGYDFLFAMTVGGGAAFNTTAGIAFDAQGGLVVTDIGNNRVLRFSPPFVAGANTPTAVLGQTNLMGTGPGNSTSGFTTPAGLLIDGNGVLYVGEYDSPRMLAFDRPFLAPLIATSDADGDGIPNGLESGEARDVLTKDNDVFTVSRLFAMQQYRDFLGREGDAGGITFQADAIDGGTARAQVIENFFSSPEFSGVVAPVTRLYFAFFNRIPDYPGLTFQVNALRTGTPLAVIANNFALSPEFDALYGNKTNTEYVQLLYQNVLGRTASQGEIDFHVNRLNSGVTRGEVMVGFSESPEYVGLKGNAVYVTNMYVGMLRRAPEPAGFDFWVQYMGAGNSGQALILGFLNAPEYRNRFLPPA